MMKDGRLQLVSRIVCERVNGPPPTPRHEAAPGLRARSSRLRVARVPELEKAR
jgi:hypothetical protein